MLFNFGKCKCLHTGHGNLDINFDMGDTVLGTTIKEKDFGITIDLTRFNKICHPSQMPRWQVDKEAIGLSRVQQCSSTYNLPS